MKKRINLIFVLLVAAVFQASAQSTSIPNVLDIKSAKQAGAIYENNKLVGYFVFYFKEQTNSKISAYEIGVFDDNYNSLKSFEISRPRNSILMEMVYNGEVFFLFFYDKKTGYEFVTFNKAGQQTGNVKVAPKEISTYDLRATVAAAANSTENATVFPLGKDGFIRQSYSKNKTVGYSLTAYSNSMKVLWTVESPADSKMVESIEINDVSEKYVTATKYNRSSALSKKVDLYFMIIDAASGKIIKDLPMGSADEGKETVLKTHFDTEESKIILVGEFYKPGDDFLKDRSQGIYTKELDNKGKILRTKQYKWEGDIDRFKLENMSEEEQKEANEGYTIFFHDVVRSKSGHLFLIGEQFRKQVSAGGVAMNTVGDE